MHQLTRLRRMMADTAAAMAAAVANASAFPADLLGKVDVDWTDIGAAGTQSQDIGLDVNLPAGTYSLVQVAGRMVSGSEAVPGVGDFQGSLVFDDGVGTPDARLVVSIGSFTGANLGGIDFSAFTVAADGSISLVLSNSGDPTNFVRMGLLVGKPIAIPFVIPGP